MKKFIYFFLFFLVSLAANSQVQRPAGTASPNSPTGFAVFGYSKSDSGFIWGKRDTFPAKFPTVIWHPNGNFYKTNGNGGAWSIFASSTAGTVSSVSGNAPISVANGTTTPTISADTSYNGLATKKWLYKTVDSLGFIKLNISDTAAMLLTRLKVSDTAFMLSGYLRKADTSAMLSNYVPTFRTIGTNAPLFGGGNLSANRTLGADTGRNAAQLVTGGSLTAVKDSLVALIASSGGGTVLSVATTDGYGVVSSVADPTSTPNISLRVDTVSISTRDWRQKGIDSVQNNLTSGLALKLNLSDTAAMLSNRLKISDTATMLLPFMQYSDTSNMLSPYRRTTTKITNSDLANSTISGISLGSNLADLTFGQYLQVGASSYNGSAATTITTNGTSTNAGSTLVARDVNGDFSARNISASQFLGTASSASTVAITNDITTNATYYPMFSTVTTGSTSTRVSSSKLTYNPSTGMLSSTGFTGALTGNASTATVLQTPRTINGVSFDGSADITISAAVANSLTAGYGITGSPFDGALARTWVIDTSNISTKANVTGALVAKLNIYDTAAMLSGYKTYYPRTAISAGTGISYNAATGVITNSSPSSGGTVTSVATNAGSGITGGTITSTGTIAADTTILSTKANVTGTLVGYTTLAQNALKVNISDTASMLSNYRRKTTLIENADLRNSAITINGSSTSLGGSISVGTVTSVATSAPITGGTITSTGTIGITQSTTSTDGYLSSTDWNTFNNKASTASVALKLNISDTAAMLSNYRRSTTLIENTDLRNSAITINGSSTSLGGSISVGTVTSVAASAGTGISVSGSPITTSGTLTITNTAPDQTVTLTAGSGISVTGTYPNFTVTNSSPSSGGTVTSVSAGIGMSFTTITSTGAVNADTTVLATRAYAAGLDVAKANTSLNNVNGVLSSTYGGAGSVSGILKANGSGVVSAAVAGTDYVAPSALSGYLPLSGGTLSGALNGTTIDINNKFSSTADAGSIGYALRGRSADNAGSIGFYNNAGSSLLSFVQHNTDLILTKVGGATLTLGTSNITSTVPISGTSLSMSGDGRFGTSTALTGIAGGIVTNSATSSGMTMRVSDVNKGYIYVSGSDVVMEGAASMNVKLLTSSGYYYNLAPSGLATSNAIRTLFNTTTDNGTDALQVAGSVRATDITLSGKANKVFSSAGSSGSPIWEEAYGYGVSGTIYGSLQFSNEYSSTFKTGARIVLHNGTANYVAQSFDATTGAATFSSSVTAASLIKSGGTSAQFLKADGSVDGSTYLTSAGAVTSIAGTTNQITVSASTGSVTVSLPSAVTISGAMNASSFFETSDLRKKDIVSVTEQADGIDFVGFKWKKELNLDSKKHLGVIAQQVEKVIPDAVTTDEKGFKSVNYTEVLIFKLQFLTEKVSELEKELKKLKTKKLKN